MEELVEQQTCFGVQNRVRTLMSRWTSAQLQARKQQRQVNTDEELESALVREVYLLETTQLSLLPRKQLQALARQVEVNRRNPDVCDDFDRPVTNTELAWLVVMTIVRDHIPHHTHQRRLVLDLPRARQPRRGTVKT